MFLRAGEETLGAGTENMIVAGRVIEWSDPRWSLRTIRVRWVNPGSGFVSRKPLKTAIPAENGVPKQRDGSEHLV